METAVIVLVGLVLCTQVAIIRQQQIIRDQAQAHDEDQLHQMLRVEDILRETKASAFQAKIVADQAQGTVAIAKIYVKTITKALDKSLEASKGGTQ